METGVMDLIGLFCLFDDFRQIFLPQYHRHLINESRLQRHRQGRMAISQMVILVIVFQQSPD